MFDEFCRLDSACMRALWSRDIGVIEVMIQAADGAVFSSGRILVYVAVSSAED